MGPGSWALPAIGRISVPDPDRPGVSIAGTAGFGITEGVLNDQDSHQRYSGSLAGAFRPVDWLAIGLRLDGRLDLHSSTHGTDNGMVGDPRLLVRGAFRVTDGLRLGLEGVVWIPGGNAPSFQMSATTIDLTGLLAWSPSSGSPFTLAVRAGYRIDNSAKSIASPTLLSAADHLALGVSSFSSVLLGLGASYRVGSAELLGEFTWDMLIGSGAPSATQSPMRLAGGARFALNDSHSLFLQAMVEGALSSRPSLVDQSVQIPVEPRVSVLASLVWRIGGDSHAVVETHAETTPAVVQETAPTPTPTVAAAAETAVVTGTIREDGGPTLPGVNVHLVVGDRSFDAVSQADGTFHFDAVPAGSAHLTATLDGYATLELDAPVVANTPSNAELVMQHAQPAGVIRGRIRSFDGRPLAANIRVMTNGQAEPVHTASASAEGTFEFEIPPGNYQVIVEAPGHDSQRRRVTVELQGVTVLNVDMRRGR